MSIAPSVTKTTQTGPGPYRLVRFDPGAAALVTSWVRDDHELFWLAPKTAPPLTAAKVIAWPGPDGCPLLLRRDGEAEPVGYAELNPMPGPLYHLWIGHCIIRPADRGLGLGRRLVELLLAEAFVQRRASAVSLVVFPDNAVAIRCYRAVGFLHVREQIKHMPTTGRQHCMLEMQIPRGRYETALQNA